MDSPLDQKLGGVLGGRTAAAFEKAFGLVTVGDLLTHFPRRYAKRGELTALDELPLDESVTIVAEVREVRERPMRQRRGSILEVKISDGRGILVLTFFNQPWREKELRPGVRGIFAGKVGDYRGSRQLAHPDYELFTGADGEPELPSNPAAMQRWVDQPIPIYPATSTVASWQIAKAIEILLDTTLPVDDPVPAEVRTDRGIVSFSRALEGIHRPERDADWQAARDALRFQEAFVLQAALLQQRYEARRTKSTPRRAREGGYRDRLDALLPFELTADQSLVGAEVDLDLSRDQPMNRLLQGEVGSGKTLVALRAMLTVADTGGQAALLAPTEVLAAQHLRSIVAMLGPDLAAELVPTLLTGQMPAAERKRSLLRAVSGQASIIVGTHALLGDAVAFYDLGLVVVDEQHRFGVNQREALRQKASAPPHVLVLTATPIPRTVAMTVFGDLDISTISELPAGRPGIESFVVPLAEHPGWYTRIWQRSAEEIAKGRQVFVVCPAIDGKREEEGEELADDGEPSAVPVAERASVERISAELRVDDRMKGFRIESLHGRMSADEKDSIMRAFGRGEVDVLIATTVIEVGIDVPNASTMVILDADRFGVSQLHQLRGRVGRGGVPGLCLLVTAAEGGSIGRERVTAVAETLDGFELAQIDLELRREGDVLGSRQSGGRSSLRLLRVAKDGEVISAARAAASVLLDSDPELAEHPALRSALAARLDESARAFLKKS